MNIEICLDSASSTDSTLYNYFILMFSLLWVLMISFIYLFYYINLFIESLCCCCPLPPCILAFVTLLLPSHYFAHSLPVCLSLLLTNLFYFPLGVCFSLVILIAHSLSIYIYIYVCFSPSIFVSLYVSLSLCVYLSLDIFVSLYVSICHSLSLSLTLCVYLSLSQFLFLSPALKLLLAD